MTEHSLNNSYLFVVQETACLHGTRVHPPLLPMLSMKMWNGLNNPVRIFNTRFNVNLSATITSSRGLLHFRLSSVGIYYYSMYTTCPANFMLSDLTHKQY